MNDTWNRILALAAKLGVEVKQGNLHNHADRGNNNAWGEKPGNSGPKNVLLDCCGRLGLQEDTLMFGELLKRAECAAASYMGPPNTEVDTPKGVGKIKRYHPTQRGMVTVVLEGDKRNHAYHVSHLVPLEKNYMSYKAFMERKIADAEKAGDALEPVDKAIRQLGLGYVLASNAERIKKAAKSRLKKLGIIPDEFDAGAKDVVLADTPVFVLKANTADSNRRLNEQALRDALDAEKLSGPAKARIMDAAFVEGTPATSFVIDVK